MATVEPVAYVTSTTTGKHGANEIINHRIFIGLSQIARPCRVFAAARWTVIGDTLLFQQPPIRQKANCAFITSDERRIIRQTDDTRRVFQTTCDGQRVQIIIRPSSIPDAVPTAEAEGSIRSVAVAHLAVLALQRDYKIETWCAFVR